MAGDGNAQTVEFIEPNFFHCPGFAIGQYDAFTGQVCLRACSNSARIASA